MAENNNENAISTTNADSMLTMQDIITIAQKVTNDQSVKVLNYQLIPYSRTKLGFLGIHRSLKITIQGKDESKSKILRLFVKSVPRGSKEETEFVTSQGFFSKESFFFREIIPALTKEYDGDKWAASSFLLKDDVLVMEDVRLEGYKMLGSFYNDYTALKSILGQVARFHACSIIAEDRLNKNSENHVTLKEHFSDACKEVMFVKIESSRWLSTNIDVASAIAESLGRDPVKLRAAFHRVHKLIEPSEIHRNVICHGDLWTNNIMCDGSLPLYKCVLVDFQIFRYAPLMLDILQLLHINSSRAFREKCEKKLIEHYHLTLEETVRKSDPSRRIHVPAFYEILAGVKDLKLFGPIIACLYCLIGPKVAAECAKTKEGYCKFVNYDVLDVVMAYMEKDKTYKSEAIDALQELADLSELLI